MLHPFCHLKRRSNFRFSVVVIVCCSKVAENNDSFKPIFFQKMIRCRKIFPLVCLTHCDVVDLDSSLFFTHQLIVPKAR